MKAALWMRVEDDRVVDLRVEPPLGAKVVRGKGRLELHLVATAAGLLERDELVVSVSVTGSSTVAVASAGATIAHPCPRGDVTRLRVEAHVGPGATLEWAPEPLIAAGGAHHHGRADVTLGRGARLRWVEELVLGRTREPTDGIRCTTELFVDDPDGPVLHDGLEVGGAAWAGPAVLGAARYVGSVLEVGGAAPPLPHDRGERFRLAGGATLTRVVDADPLAGRARLRTAAPVLRVA